MQRMTDKGRMNTSEARLKDLLSRGLDGEATAYQAFLTEMSTHLRAYFGSAWPVCRTKWKISCRKRC